MGLLSVTSAIFLMATMWASQRNICDVSATPSGIKREWCVWSSFNLSSVEEGSSGARILIVHIRLGKS
jgi:hypothetical protein